MKLKKPVFNIGDKVRIINPEVFIRIGYPLGIYDVIGEIDKHDTKIASFLLDVDAPWFNAGVIDKMTNDIKKILAYGILNVRNFGGKERKIFIERQNDLFGRIGKVISKRIVRTGIYKESRQTYNDDFISPYLEADKNHIILFIDTESYLGRFNIEAKNVEKFIE